jgi:hypothetical protein
MTYNIYIQNCSEYAGVTANIQVGAFEENPSKWLEVYTQEFDRVLIDDLNEAINALTDYDDSFYRTDYREGYNECIQDILILLGKYGV